MLENSPPARRRDYRGDNWTLRDCLFADSTAPGEKRRRNRRNRNIGVVQAKDESPPAFQREGFLKPIWKEVDRMRIRLFTSRARQRGSIPPALLSAGSTWHTRPLAASVCTVVPAAAVAPGHSRAFLRPMRHLTHHHSQSETVGRRHPRSLTRQGFDASGVRKRTGNRDRGRLGVLYPYGKEVVYVPYSERGHLSRPPGPAG